MQVQIAIRGKKPAGVVITRDTVQQWINDKADGRALPAGVDIQIIAWKNPARPGGGKWTTGPQGEAWRTLKEALRFAIVGL